MKNSFIKLLSVAATALALSGTAQAALITGSIDFSGGATLDNATVSLATKVVSFSGVAVVNPFPNGTTLGSITNGTSVNMAGAANWSFNSGALPAFWVVNSGGAAGTITFNLASSSLFSNAGGFITVNGFGTMSASGAGFDVTNGTWQFSTQGGQDVNFSFSSTTTAQAPDGGTTAVMAGMALVGLALFRRRLA